MDPFSFTAPANDPPFIHKRTSGMEMGKKEMNLPLDGIRVLDLSRTLAGPYCASLLGEMGAEVIKVEQPGEGEENRRWPPVINGESCNFLSVNRNKKSITVNLKERDGQKIVREMVARGDVFIESFRPGTMEKMGLGYEALMGTHPRLIYCSISGYGEKGPLREMPGYDMTLQAYTGHMAITGEQGKIPIRMAAPILDMSTGITAYGAIVTALLSRSQTGRGQKISCSLLQTGVSLLGYHAVNFLAAGILPTRAGSGVWHLVPYQAFPTKDGFVVVGAPNERAWKEFCKALQAEPLAADPRFATNADRLAHREELIQLLSEIFRKRTSEEWVGVLNRAGLVGAAVRSVDQVLTDEQVLANEMVVRLNHPRFDSLRLLGMPANFSETPGRPQLPPPLLGEHTEEILTWLGYSQEAIQGLKERGVV
jgi:formyl-CoA transferase/CoA:oxalate CoA-transferase